MKNDPGKPTTSDSKHDAATPPNHKASEGGCCGTSHCCCKPAGGDVGAKQMPAVTDKPQQEANPS